MFCRYCGKELANTAKFCRYCGKEVKVAPEVRGDGVQASATSQQQTAGQSVTSQPAVTRVAQAKSQNTSQPANAEAQAAPQGTSAYVKNADDGALDVYIDKLRENLAKTENPLLKGRSLGNLTQAVCWAFMVLSFFVPFVTVRELVLKGRTYTQADSYSGMQLIGDLFSHGFTFGSDSEIGDLFDGLFMGIIVMFFVMLFFIGKNIYQNKNTIKSHKNTIIWCCVDFAYQALIFWWVVFCNDELNSRISLTSTYNPYDAGPAVYLMILAASVIIAFAAGAIVSLKEAQAGKTEDAEGAPQNS